MERLKKVFICSPYRGDVAQNVQKAKQYCKIAVQKNCLPIAPHLYFPIFLNDEKETERILGIQFGLQLLKQCDQIWVFKTPTQGMKKEIQFAKKLNKNIILF